MEYNKVQTFKVEPLRPYNKGQHPLKNFMLGFLSALSICLLIYIIWDGYRYVPVLIKQVPVPIPTREMDPNLHSKVANINRGET